MTRPKGRASGRIQPISADKTLDAQEREQLLSAAAAIAPDYYTFVLFLLETGCRIGEAIALNWPDVDLDARVATVIRCKTGGQATEMKLSDRLCAALRQERARWLRSALREGRGSDDSGDGLVFSASRGGAIRVENFRKRVWGPVIREAFGPDRHLTPHCLRHTWATLHLARGTPLKWVQQQGGWASAKMLMDVYGHYLPREMSGHANALAPPSEPDSLPSGVTTHNQL